MSGFTLIRGVGIFPTDDIARVMPQYADNITFSITPPQTSEENFSFALVNETEVYLELFLYKSLEETVKKKKGKDEEEDDSNVYPVMESTQIIRTERTFDFATLAKVLGIDDDTAEKMNVRIKNFKKHLAREEEYQSLKAAVPTDVNDQGFGAANTAAANAEPSSKDRAKQEERIPYLEEHIQKAVAELVKDEDSIEEALNTIFNREEDEQFPVDLKAAMDQLLQSFYDDNMRPAEELEARLERVSQSSINNKKAEKAG